MKIKNLVFLFIMSAIFCSSSLKNDPITILKEFIVLIHKGDFTKAKNYVTGNESAEIIEELKNLWKVNSKSFNKEYNYNYLIVKNNGIDILINVKDENNSINISLKKINEEWRVILKSAAIIDLVRGNTRDEDAYADDYIIEIGDFEEEQKNVNHEKNKSSNTSKSNSSISVKPNSNLKYNCQECQGKGYKLGCQICANKGTKNCLICKGEKRYLGKICYSCDGIGKVVCYRCNGSPNKERYDCYDCCGTGYLVSKSCTNCNGKELQPGDKFYYAHKIGTHCGYCGGSGTYKVGPCSKL
jgi:hypothetical protein